MKNKGDLSEKDIDKLCVLQESISRLYSLYKKQKKSKNYENKCCNNDNNIENIISELQSQDIFDSIEEQNNEYDIVIKNLIAEILTINDKIKKLPNIDDIIAKIKESKIFIERDTNDTNDTNDITDNKKVENKEIDNIQKDLLDIKNQINNDDGVSLSIDFENNKIKNHKNKNKDRNKDKTNKLINKADDGINKCKRRGH